MNTTMFKAVALRFLRAFVSGALAQMAAFIASSHEVVGTLTDFQAWAFALLTAAIAGGIMALDKLLRFQ